MNLFQFVRSYWRLPLFGLSFTFFSNFGQTFLVSLFVPGFLAAFEMSNASFGTLYSAATMSSAITLVWIGSKIDRISLKRYAFMVTAGLVLASLILAFSLWIWMLFLGLFAIRLFGQGLSSHTAHTAMGRYFITMRGKALSISSLGYTLGEAILPITITALITAAGWRFGWITISLFIALALPAIIIFTLGRNPQDSAEKKSTGFADGASQPGSNWRRSTVLRDYRFYLFLPGILISPFLLTGIFLYQTRLAEFKGWEIEILASAFIAFAAAKSIFSLVGGPMVDRFRACRMFPFFLIPFFTGLLVLTLSSHSITPFLYLFLAGMSEGFGANIKTSIYAELYGTANLGTIRSMISMFVVISTAISPILFGHLLDAGIPFGSIIQGSMGLMIVIMVLGSFMYREARNIIS
ncbi:MFS transporter [Balneolales bacterium ANBcel1]|nr:MFS transporter [Balneolales bacterium ANBcel1]